MPNRPGHPLNPLFSSLLKMIADRSSFEHQPMSPGGRGWGDTQSSDTDLFTPVGDAYLQRRIGPAPIGSGMNRTWADMYGQNLDQDEGAGFQFNLPNPHITSGGISGYYDAPPISAPPQLDAVRRLLGGIT